MTGIIGAVVSMVGGRCCDLEEILKISILVQRLFSDRTITSSACYHLKSSEFNYERVWKIMFYSG